MLYHDACAQQEIHMHYIWSTPTMILWCAHSRANILPVTNDVISMSNSKIKWNEIDNTIIVIGSMSNRMAWNHNDSSEILKQSENKSLRIGLKLVYTSWAAHLLVDIWGNGLCVRAWVLHLVQYLFFIDCSFVVQQHTDAISCSTYNTGFMIVMRSIYCEILMREICIKSEMEIIGLYEERFVKTALHAKKL